jgi:hypothetical protein
VRTLLAATLLAATLLLLPISTAPKAPVYRYADDAVLSRSGSYEYTEKEGYSILYCIADTTVWLHCVVHTPKDELVVIEVRAQELTT